MEECHMRNRLMFAVLAASLIAGAQTLDETATERAVAHFSSICDAQGKAVWGASLCGPIVVVNPRTRSSVASQVDPDGKFIKRGDVWVGALPASFDPANTAFDWGGRKWTMVMAPLPKDPFLQLALITHESFHRVQAGIGLASSDQPNAHLDTETGRVWLRLELRALARALRAEHDQELRAAITDALTFRARRYELHAGAREREASMERQEGLAEYTGYAIALKDTGESASRVARIVESFEDSDAYARSFAYVTGPALGLLLDRVAPGWHARARSGGSMESLLIAAVRFQPSSPVTAATHYGFRAVAAAEREREARHQTLLDSLTKRFVDGPTLVLGPAGNLNRAFNPNELVPFGAHGTYYPTGTFRAKWGKLQVDSVGAVLSSDNMSVRVAAPSDPQGQTVKGPGWTLELAPGWTIQATERGFNLTFR